MIKPRQRVLVHGFNVGEVGDAKVQNLRVVRHWNIPLADFVNFLFRLHGNRLLLFDFLRHDFGRVQRLDGRLVLENVALGRGERVQDLVLDLLEDALVLGGLEHEARLLLLELRPLLGDDDAEQLEERRRGEKKGKGRGRGNGGGNNKSPEAVKGSLSGTFVLKNKKHPTEIDEYLFLSGSKAYTISRAIYDEVEGNLDRNVTIECKVVRGDRIIAIRAMN